MKFKRIPQSLIWLMFLFCLSDLANADTQLLNKKPAKAFIQKMVDKYGFNRAEVANALKEAAYKPDIIESMNKPFEKKSWDAYQSIFLTQERLDKGLEFWQKHEAVLHQAEKQYGVPAAMIVAILGVETRYGERQGSYRVLDALATLAFYYPKRAAYFARELEEYLLLCKELDVPVTHFVGSYAGAIGQPQFMPSNYRMYAVDYKTHAKPDLVSESQDAIVSVANYFKRHGWAAGRHVIFPAEIQGKGYKSIQANGRQANYKLKHMMDSGVLPKAPLPEPPTKVGLIVLDKSNKARDFWLAYPNFYVIMRYNTSPQYALVVYLLSKQLEQEWQVKHT